MSRYVLLEIILPPAILCVVLIIFVYVIYLKRNYFCIAKTRRQSRDQSISYDMPTISGHVLMPPSANIGAAMPPPSYAECVVQRPGNSVLEIPPSYDELFGWEAPSDGDRWALSVVSNDNYIMSRCEAPTGGNNSDIIAQQSNPVTYSENELSITGQTTSDVRDHQDNTTVTNMHVGQGHQNQTFIADEFV